MIFNYLKRKNLENKIAIAKLARELSSVNNDASLSTAYRGSELYDVLTSGSVSYAGPAITENVALSVSAVYSCIRLIAGAIASLPLPIYERTKDGRKKVDHDLWWILNEQPTESIQAATYWEYIVTSFLLHGDGFGLIRRNNGGLNSGDIRAIELAHPQRVGVKNLDNRLKYALYGDSGIVVKDQDDMLHFPGFGFNGLRGLSPIQYTLKQAAGLSIAAEEYSARFFSNGARPDIAIEVPGNLKDDQVDILRESWSDRYGGASKSHLPAILTGGVKVHELTMRSTDAELIRTRQFQIIDIARIYGVPPWMIGESEKQTSWGSGVEQAGIGFVKYTLRPHLRRMEQEINRKFFRTPKYFVEFNVDGLMEGDSKAQAEYFAKALGGPGSQGWMSVNEVRRLKNLQPIDGNDEIIKAGSANEQTNKTINQQ